MVATHEYALSILVMTEDGSRDARAIVSALLKRLLVHLDPACQTQRIAFDPASDLDDIVRANLWKGRRAERIRLHRRVAQQLRNEDGFVVHHVDADQTWADRNQSDNVARLRSDILPPIYRQLLDYYRQQNPNISDEQLNRIVEVRMTRYLCLLPHWELEAWLYQHTARATSLCPGPPRCQRRPSCRSKLAGWRDDRGALDEVPHPSDELCFGKQHNADLVQGYPTEAVYRAGKSLAAAVDAMLGCDALLHAIQRTYETSPGVLEST